MSAADFFVFVLLLGEFDVRGCRLRVREGDGGGVGVGRSEGERGGNGNGGGRESVFSS